MLAAAAVTTNVPYVYFLVKKNPPAEDPFPVNYCCYTLCELLTRDLFAIAKNFLVCFTYVTANKAYHIYYGHVLLKLHRREISGKTDKFIEKC